MKLHQIIRDYFTFSRNERRGITILLFLIFVLALANRFFFYFEKPATFDAAFLDSAKIQLESANFQKENVVNKTWLFEFDPNSIDSIRLAELDLPVQVKRNLLKFRNKGGRFYSAADFKKLYGVTDSIYERVFQYLRMDTDVKKEIVPELQEMRFSFNPNTAADADFQKLGFSEKLISNIRKYQSKGGVFRKKEDFLKIYGLSEKQKTSLTAYITLADIPEIQAADKDLKPEELIELNTADSIQLKQISGIGAKLSVRIIKYRDLLGGFYSSHQLLEVYGLKEPVFTKISGIFSIDTTKIRKLNLNFADENEFSKHPYLTKNLAAKIVKFRTKYGSIQRVSTLRDSMILNIDEFRKIRPYFKEQK